MADKKKKDFGNDLTFDNPAFAFLTPQPAPAPVPKHAPEIQQEQPQNQPQETDHKSEIKSNTSVVNTSKSATKKSKENPVPKSTTRTTVSNNRFATGPKSESNASGELELINPTSVSDAFNTLGNKNAAIRRKTCKISKSTSYNEPECTYVRFSIAINYTLNDELVRIADENGISRNHLVNILLKHGIETLDSQELEDN